MMKVLETFFVFVNILETRTLKPMEKFAKFETFRFYGKVLMYMTTYVHCHNSYLYLCFLSRLWHLLRLSVAKISLFMFRLTYNSCYITVISP